MMPPPGRVIGGGQITPTCGGVTPQATGGGNRSIDPIEYVKFIQKSISGVSPVVIRGLVNKHLEMDPDMTKQAMLKKIRAQVKQI